MEKLKEEPEDLRNGLSPALFLFEDRGDANTERAEYEKQGSEAKSQQPEGK
jgi:hypothetical protein